jgi:ABC-type oligopeptide transport system ATPase subunit
VTILDIRALTVVYPGRDDPAVLSVDLSIKEGKTLGLVGQSGSGKSTLARCVLGLLKPSSGTIEFRGMRLDKNDRRTWKVVRPQLQIVFQDPHTSLNPRLRVGSTIADPLHTFGIVPRRAVRSRVGELLEMVELPREFARRFPHQLSGGQRQRVSIARALASDPRLVVLDEPTSALDVSVGAKILKLLLDIQKRLGTTYLFVSHDLATIRQVADEVAVMLAGRIVEMGSADQILKRPQHPYTKALLNAVLPPTPGDHFPRRLIQPALVKPSAE